MMNILLPVLVVAVIGIAAGILLSVLSILMHVPKDEKQEAVREVLPGANCGACGYAGCDAYAEAVAKGEAEVTLCIPGGDTVKDAIANVMGVEAGAVDKKIAAVHCFGTCEHTQDKMKYIGEKTCRSAMQMFGGPGSCSYGCLGFGDCKTVCDYGAIDICDGVAVIRPDLCVGCSMCVRECPKSIISMVPTFHTAVVSCSSRDKGGDVRKICDIGCTGCTRCQRVCKHDAIHVQNFLAVVTPEKCTGCGDCVTACPQKCIRLQ